MRVRQRDRHAAWLCIAALAGALAAVGGAPRWGALIAAALGLAAAAPYLASSRRLAAPPPLLVFLGLATAFTALQLVPLPYGLVALLSPVRAETAAGSAAVLGGSPPSWLPVTMDVPATLVELAKLAGYLGFAYAALRVSARSAGTLRLIRAVALCGAAVAAIAAVHYVAGIDRLYGIYQPERSPLGFVAPLLNPNHLAGFLVVATCAAIGLGLAAAHPQRLAWLALAGGTAALAMLQRSRGGALALAVGVGVTAALWLYGRRRTEPRRRRSSRAELIGAGIVATCVVALIVAFTASGVAAELAHTDRAELAGESEGKIAAWRASSRLLGEFPWTGVGRGAFEPSFSRVHTPDGARLYSHVENEYLQAVIDWGWPAAAMLLLAAVWFGTSAARRITAGPLQAAAAGGLVALLVQNLADFSLELPGVALAALTLAAVLDEASLRSSPPERLPQPRSLRTAGLAAGLVALALAAGPWARSARADREVLAAALERRDPAVVARAEAAMARHPADFFAPATAAQALFRAGDVRAVALANWALTLNPRHAGLHRLAGRMLLSAGRPEQACGEYRLAMRYQLEPWPLAEEVLARFSDPEAAARCFPGEKDRLGRLIDQVAQRRPDVALAVARRAAEATPDNPEILRRLGQLELKSGHADRAGAILRETFAADDSADSALALAGSLLAEDRVAEAAQLLRDSARRTTDEREIFDLLTALADAYLEREQPAKAREVLREALTQVGHDRRLRSSIHGRLSKAERALGNTHRADWEAARARDLGSP